SSRAIESDAHRCCFFQRNMNGEDGLTGKARPKRGGNIGWVRLMGGSGQQFPYRRSSKAVPNGIHGGEKFVGESVYAGMRPSCLRCATQSSHCIMPSRFETSI